MADTKHPSLFQSFVPLIFLVGLLGMNVAFYADDSLGGANQMALLLSAGVAAIVALLIGQKWGTLFDGVISSIGSALHVSFVLLFPLLQEVLGPLLPRWV